MQKVDRREALKFFGLEPTRKTLFITGGSLGAMKLNSAVLEVVDNLINLNYQMVWQTGSIDYERVKESLKGKSRNIPKSQNSSIEWRAAYSAGRFCRL